VNQFTNAEVGDVSTEHQTLKVRYVIQRGDKFFSGSTYIDRETTRPQWSRDPADALFFASVEGATNAIARHSIKDARILVVKEHVPEGRFYSIPLAGEVDHSGLFGYAISYRLGFLTIPNKEEVSVDGVRAYVGRSLLDITEVLRSLSHISEPLTIVGVRKSPLAERIFYTPDGQELLRLGS